MFCFNQCAEMRNTEREKHAIQEKKGRTSYKKTEEGKEATETKDRKQQVKNRKDKKFKKTEEEK